MGKKSPGLRRIISKVGMIFFSIIIGSSQGMQPIVGFNYGAKSTGGSCRPPAGHYCRFGYLLLWFSLLSALPRQIIALFGSGSDIYFQFAERYFRIYMFATFLNGSSPSPLNSSPPSEKRPREYF